MSDVVRKSQWHVYSEKDPRWNNQGITALASGDDPQEMRDWIAECEREYGEQPTDLCITRHAM